MTQNFCMGQFIGRIPWDSDAPDIIAILDFILQKGMDFKIGKDHVQLIRVDARYDLNLYELLPTGTTQSTTTRYLLTEQRKAIQSFVTLCNEIQDAFDLLHPEPEETDE